MLLYYQQTKGDLIDMGATVCPTDFDRTVLVTGIIRWVPGGWFAGNTNIAENEIYVREDCDDL